MIFLEIRDYKPNKMCKFMKIFDITENENA